MIWLGILGAVGHYFMIKACEKASATLLASFDYTKLIWTFFIDYFLFDHLPDAWTILGATIIVYSGLYLIRHETNINA
jgi:drug/metabolite transporter (DMT)-like permease